MKKTRVCELLGIEYPILQGGMNWISNAELAAAVSNAGALGILSPSAGASFDSNLVDVLQGQIRKTRDLTNKPFGVNLPLSFPQIKDLIDLIISEGVTIVTTSAGNPATYTEYLKNAGIKVVHVVASAKHAVSAEVKGVDAVVAEGYEAGGHNGFDELPTFVLVPQVVDAVKIPVLAAGGIMDARGFVAARVLGAEGVQMGTRFIATYECCAHANFKDALIKARDIDTCITGRNIGPTRGLKTGFALEVAKKESAGVSSEELLSFIGAGRARRGQIDGDFSEGEGYCGAGSGMIKEIIPAGDVVKQIVAEIDNVISGVQ